MLVAISQRHGPERGGSDVLESRYANYFNRFDANLVPIPNIGKLARKYFDQMPISGVILSGGGEVHPRLYGGDQSVSGNYSVERDETERTMLELALTEGIPVLGICRGIQAINVHFGGKLIQSLDRDVENALNHANTTHEVTITDRDLTEHLGTNSVEVNSYHRLGIMQPQLSPELIPFAIAKDQTIEAVYHPKHAVAAIMWHPERWESPRPIDTLLTKAFISRDIFWKRDKEGTR